MEDSVSFSRSYPSDSEICLYMMSASGYHVPAVRRRDRFYAKLEQERAKALGQL